MSSKDLNSSSSSTPTTTKEKKDKSKDKQKEKEKNKMKTLHKRSLKKWLTKSKSKHMLFDKDAVFGGIDDSTKTGIENKDQKKSNDSDDSDNSDSEEYDIDDDKLDSMIKTQDSHPLTPKEVGDMHIKRMKERFQIEIQFKSLEDVLEIAQEDNNRIIFMIHCVDWFNLSRLTIENFKNILSKEKDVLYFFINQSSPEYNKDNPMDIAGIPFTKIFYKQNPIKIQRYGIEYDWGLDDKIRGHLTLTQIKTILEECRECKQSVDSDLQSYNSDNPPPLEIKLEF
ncbi:hypothetical protein DFA_10448 [Cavenderia fasciculata]|uniref:Uncharacterized protein n=1 Tax=Cavenderia fasciculata TaxID=261658 RepID=F4QA87_CACFS|nr:uncharacterized protein DFA_10448 [Cavenderia fasciculata]EGG15606.1 hypothetical protein DFA_10448 [Cavenderia fasciculata]|eukprot:XP_004354348.1 hypothetical protein DFA_10448 [Cavenderia fasciculata]